MKISGGSVFTIVQLKFSEKIPAVELKHHCLHKHHGALYSVQLKYKFATAKQCSKRSLQLSENMSACMRLCSIRCWNHLLRLNTLYLSTYSLQSNVLKRSLQLSENITACMRFWSHSHRSRERPHPPQTPPTIKHQQPEKVPISVQIKSVLLNTNHPKSTNISTCPTTVQRSGYKYQCQYQGKDQYQYKD